MTRFADTTDVRYLPDEPLPPYAYRPGRTPHPTRDPGGHRYRAPPVHVAPPDPRQWHACRPYLYGVDLFNHGYYWEAHEAWESLWHACGRSGVTADFLRALIRLAAAGFKERERRAIGRRRHATAAADLFRSVAARLGPGHARYFGVSLAALAESAEAAATGINLRAVTDDERPAPVFDFLLQPA